MLLRINPLEQRQITFVIPSYHIVLLSTSSCLGFAYSTTCIEPIMPSCITGFSPFLTRTFGAIKSFINHKTITDSITIRSFPSVIDHPTYFNLHPSYAVVIAFNLNCFDLMVRLILHQSLLGLVCFLRITF